jgi:hypothetical protein
MNYLHVVDLATQAVDRLIGKRTKPIMRYLIGCGKGVSVLKPLNRLKGDGDQPNAK